MTMGSHTQRAAAWLSLLVAVFIALVPASGVTVCLGHDGHLGLGVGVASVGTGDSVTPCPCQHDTAHSMTAHSAPSQVVDAEHPPCDDLVLDCSEVVRESSSGSPLAAAMGDLDGHDLPPLPSTRWGRGGLWPDRDCVLVESWVDAARHRPSQQLELRRSVVLLI
jgi:hypothetical protein